MDVNLREGNGFGSRRYSSSVSRHGSSSSSSREGAGEECTDVIRVTDRGKTLLTMCGESKADVQILSHSSKLEVRKPIAEFHCSKVCVVETSHHQNIFTCNILMRNFYAFANICHGCRLSNINCVASFVNNCLLGHVKGEV